MMPALLTLLMPQVEEAQRKAAEAAAEQQGLPKPGTLPPRPKRQVGGWERGCQGMARCGMRRRHRSAAAQPSPACLARLCTQGLVIVDD